MTLLAQSENVQHVMVQNEAPLADAPQRDARQSSVHVEGKLASQAGMTEQLEHHGHDQPSNIRWKR